MLKAQHMDLRDIQRLHAQFAPDSMTIDLPRQVAALPAPADLTAEVKAAAIKLRLPKSAPVVRRSVVAVAIAAVVAMAGVGAASLYKSLHATSARSASGQPTLEAQADAPKDEKKESRLSHATLRPVDAEPPRPPTIAPMLTAKDLAPAAPMGLTADQFKRSMGTSSGPAVSAAAPATKPASALSNEDQRAAASPIRQSHRENEAPAHAVIKPTARAPMASAAPGPSVAQATAQDHTSPTSSAEPAKSHGRRHSRSREEQIRDGDATSAASKKPASVSRAGANEVQMF
jgi:hypothetical protein